MARQRIAAVLKSVLQPVLQSPLPALLSLLVSTCCLGQANQNVRYLTPAAYPEQDAAAVWRSLGASYVRKAMKDNQLDRDPVLNARLDAVMSAVGVAAGKANPQFSGAVWRAL